VEDRRSQEGRGLVVGVRSSSLRRGCNHGGYIYRGPTLDVNTLEG
jgi:hypothetical protein